MPAPEEILPPVPHPPEGEQRLTSTVKVYLRGIRVEGCTVFSDGELSEIINPYLYRELVSEDLADLRRSLTMLYINNGYINSGAVIPDQTVNKGTINVRIIEGRLNRINILGNRWFQDGYFDKRISLDSEPPLNIAKLQKRLLILNQDPRILKINADLRPDILPGQSILDVRIKEDNPFKVWLDYDNYIPPSVGSEERLITLEHQNFTGIGDILSFTLGRSSGIDPQMQASYSLPLSARDTRLKVHYANNEYTVISQAFQSLDIESTSDRIGISIERPFFRSLTDEFTIGIMGEYIKNRSYLLGEPFSISPGAQKGESVVSAIRLFQNWLSSNQIKALGIYSQVTFGVNALNSTDNPSGIPDSQFLAWLLRFQWAQRHTEWADLETVLRTDLQMSTEPLLPMEQIAIGGRYSVRGYRENLLVRDNAFIGSFEGRVPLVQNRSWADYVQITPFFDFGWGWNTDWPTPDPKTISGTGVGLRWALTVSGSITLKPELEFYKGFALRDVPAPDDSRQDDGIHFRFLLRVF